MRQEIEERQRHRVRETDTQKKAEKRETHTQRHRETESVIKTEKQTEAEK